MIKGKYALFGLVLITALMSSGCSHDIPAVNCQEPDFDCLTQHAINNINIVKKSVAFWSNVNIIGGVSTVIFGIIATLMLALQGDTNKRWTRPIGIIATTLVTGISSALISFHVPENVDKLIDIAGRMLENTGAYAQQVEELRAGRDKRGVDSAYKSDPAFREKAIKIMADFSAKQNALKMEMLRLKGTAASLNISPQSATLNVSPQSPKNN